MKTLTLEVNKEADLDLMLALAKRLKLKSNVYDDNMLTDYADPITLKPLTAKALRERLERAENQPGISMEEFQKRLKTW